MSTWKQMIADAKELLDMGAITQEEFEQTKREAFALRSQSTNPGTTTPPARPPRQDTLMGSTGMGSTGFGNTGMGNTGGDPFGGDTLAGVTQFQAVGQTIGSYKVLGEIGQGGMGTVYRARHSVEAFAQQTGDVVIKLMNPQYAQDPTFRQRFITEAATGRNIQHPNVVRIHDVIVEEHNNILAIVMDLVEGRPLEDIIPSGGLPLKQALPIIEQLSGALDHLHSTGIIHRDLKPENIIVSPSGKPVILDMGIAKNTDSDMNVTRTSTAMGTPLYMAPEQTDAKNVTSAADRYAFGLIVYQMLSGRLPWDGSSGPGMITAYKMMGNLTPLHEVCSVSESVSKGVMSMLRTQAVDRTGDCKSFYTTLIHTGPKPLDVVSFGSGTGRHEMVVIPKGEFTMGALENDEDADDDEIRHKVTLTRDFLMGKYPVTHALWESVMGSNPSHFKGENRPVEQVSWFDVVDFCNKLSKREGLTPAYTINGENVTCNWNAKGYRLPTEAEWEYSARSGQSFIYAGSNNVDEVAWYSGNSGKQTHPVGQKKPNGFGLYDMSGNVFEWCWDRWVYYSSGNQTDPTGPDSGPNRVFRGGSWYYFAGLSRVSFRLVLGPTSRDVFLGFRLSRLIP